MAYQDLLARVIPEPFLPRGYNTSDAISWGDPIHRTNGVIFLEPSLFSFFLGLAVVVALDRRKSLLTVGLLLLAMLPTVAGNGFVIILAGVGTLALRGRWRELRSLVLPTGLVVLGVLAVPGADRFVTRASEVGVQGSRGSLRMIEPDTRLLPEFLKDPASLALGNGAGTTAKYLASIGPDGLLSPAIPKLLFEYGVLGTVLFLIFLVTALRAGSRLTPWTLGVLIAYLVINAALQQATFALVTILFVRLLTAGDADTEQDHRRRAAEGNARQGAQECIANADPEVVLHAGPHRAPSHQTHSYQPASTTWGPP